VKKLSVTCAPTVPLSRSTMATGVFEMFAARFPSAELRITIRIIGMAMRMASDPRSRTVIVTSRTPMCTQRIAAAR
jgi:hypothetical protein